MRHLALAADDVAGDTEVLTEIGVSCGDDSADQAAVSLIVEEPDDLPGHRPFFFAAALAPAVGGGDQNERLVDSGMGCPGWSGIRTARIPRFSSFSMKRAVLPEMLEK